MRYRVGKVGDGNGNSGRFGRVGRNAAGIGIVFELQEMFVKRSVYTAGTVVICNPDNTVASSTAHESSTIRAYYIFLARCGASAHTDRHARWFGPFATMAQARMIRTSAFNLGLAVDETASRVEQHANDMTEPQWGQLANA